MVNLLVAIHAIAGILAIFAFLFVFIELLSSAEKTIKRIQIFAYMGTILIFISWIVGGYYYVNYYGPNVKPIIKQGSTPWVHSVIMETKEHVFLFLPFLALSVFLITFLLPGVMTREKNLKTAVAFLAFAAQSIALVVAVATVIFGGMNDSIISPVRTTLVGCWYNDSTM